MKIAFIGLGKMGGRMSAKLLTTDHEIVGLDPSPEARLALQTKFPHSEKLSFADNLQQLVAALPSPKIIYLMLPAGEITNGTLSQLKQLVETDDIIIDGGNSHYADTQRHYDECTANGVRFLGIGTSGGILAAENGYPMMAGGDKSAYEYIKPLLDSLALPNGGHDYFGTGGAGHYVKMVHNGIEYPVMQALGEGFGILASSQYNFDLVKVAKLYQKGSLVSGFMLDRAVEALEDDAQLSDIAGIIGAASGEAAWAIDEAKKYNLPAESIAQAIDFRRRSESDSYVQSSFAAKMVGALRIKFGGHPVKKVTDEKN